MAVINKNDKVSSLKALTATALSLPGILSPIAHAADGDEVDFQYSHYQEGKRDISVSEVDGSSSGISGTKSFNPIEVDSLHGSARVSLTDRVKFAFNYLQDTWGGATPMATVPYLASGNRAIKNTADALTGASPYAIAGAGLKNLFLGSRSNRLFQTDRVDPNTGLPVFKNDTRLTHVLATASPETRKQGDFKLSYDWDNAAVSVGGGISIEDDYDSRFGNIGGRFDFNQKQTTLNVDLSYTNSYTHATLDHDDYTKKSLLPSRQLTEIVGESGTTIEKTIIHGTRQDWATHFGLTQVVNKDVLLGADFSYTRSTGYQSNPYKGVAIAFVDNNPDSNTYGDLPPGVFPTQIAMFTEQRPDVRNQYAVGGRYVQYINALDAALHFDYRFSADDWGIQAHTFEGDWVQPLGSGWTVTPRIRYYSQDAADFYAPFLISQQRYTLDRLVDPNKLPAHYSSDQRLSGFGTLSGGLTVTKQFAKGLALETGFEYYTHQGGLKLGGGGESAYADFDYWVANAALKVNLSALGNSGAGHASHDGHAGHQHGAHEPAGVMFAHTLPKAGDFMVGYRYMWNSQGGDMLNGTSPVSDQAVVDRGCTETDTLGCFLTPESMSMSMHMLDLMYAPTDWLTLMLMPQFVDMQMGMRGLDGAQSIDIIPNNLGHHITHHIQNPHETGGIGDLGMYALVKLFDNGLHHVHATAGLSAPTGDVDLQIRRAHANDGGYHDYGMQLGSGTWDFKPSLTYTGQVDKFSWGAQANGIVRMEGKNKSGYRLGDMFQGMAWGGYNLTNWLTATVRGVYTVQGSIKGQYNGSSVGQFFNPNNPKEETGFIRVNSQLRFGPQDYPSNYGGRFWDVGFGLSAVVPSGDLAGNRFSVEWLQPVYTDFNGYQLDRDGALSATWGVAF
ncbi:DUF3570 domain-containing protein [Methyloglobulus morosus]|uniref:DUF3570 domain-containing protein n=1 Tax=Methyloglobulus morosus TaxID=1410681 RepID=UPI0003FF177E|nr:DUF3570 domain-containing protein [Methyloglobulus morosus]